VGGRGGFRLRFLAFGWRWNWELEKEDELILSE
jgi:hypothetical protein